MALTEGKLGNYIELRDVRNADLRYGADRVRGVNTTKQMMPTRADLSARDLSKFQVVSPGEFVFNHRTSRNGSKFSIAYNDSERDVICTEDYVIFRVSDYGKQFLLAEWLFIFFNRPEFDRYVITNSWGSSTEFYNWEDLCDVNIVLPPLLVQQKYVDIYNFMLTNQRAYKSGLDDLRLACEAFIDRLKYSERRAAIGDLLEEVDTRNTDGKIDKAHGINIAKQFMLSVASSSDLLKYKVVKKGQFAYSSMQTGRDKSIRIALFQGNSPIAVSPAYSVLRRKTDEVVEEYVQMWFSRGESDRLGWFMSDSSVRANLDLSRFYEIEIPLPNIETQESLVKIYNSYITRQEIYEKLKTQIKDICPILIKGSLEEARA